MYSAELFFPWWEGGEVLKLPTTAELQLPSLGTSTTVTAARRRRGEFPSKTGPLWFRLKPPIASFRSAESRACQACQASVFGPAASGEESQLRTGHSGFLEPSQTLGRPV